MRWFYLLPVLLLAACGKTRVSEKVFYDQSSKIQELEENVAQLQEQIAQTANIPWWMLIPPDTMLRMAATGAAALGAFLFVIAWLALYFMGRKTFIAIMAIALSLICSAPILAFMGVWLAWIGVGVAVGLSWYIWRNIDMIEEWLGIDINRDGLIGGKRRVKRKRKC